MANQKPNKDDDPLKKIVENQPKAPKRVSVARNPRGYTWSARSIALVAIFTTVLVISARISVPVGPVPMTLQTLAVGIMATITTYQIAAVSMDLYLLLGAFGMPVFAGGKGGVGILFGPTGGYLWSMLLMVMLISLLTRVSHSVRVIAIANAWAATLNLLLGMIWLMVVTNIQVGEAFVVGVIPFILTTIIKIVAITSGSVALIRANRNQIYK
jgi:biotin transport system substrate-specific component